jgi:nucleoside-diphosphate-sugar epimerase
VLELPGSATLEGLLAGVDVVVHAAARVHLREHPTAQSLDEYRRVNVDGTIRLAESSLRAGVKQFIYLSSVKVNGEVGRFSETSIPHPSDPYGISKLEAERALVSLGARTGLATVIIRPPLIYGPGVGANFRALLRLVSLGWPLPFGRINNRRSLVYVDNLVDFIRTCVLNPNAQNQLFFVSDGEDLALPNIVRGLAAGMGQTARLVAVPPKILWGAAIVAGRRADAGRLLDSLQVDISKARLRLGWIPPISSNTGLAATGGWYKGSSRG